METLFFLASKTLGLLLSPGIWLIAWLGLVLIFWPRRGARRVLLGGVLALVLLGLIPVGQIWLQRIEARSPHLPPLTEVTGIVQLGGAEDLGQFARTGDLALNGAAERYTATRALAEQFPQALVVFAGGSGDPGLPPTEDRSEAALARALHTALGLDPARLILEGRSRNTAENATRLVEVLPDRSGTWLLVTSAAHMPRAHATFAAAGWPELLPYPVDLRGVPLSEARIRWNLIGNLAALKAALREEIGLIVYRATGRA